DALGADPDFITQAPCPSSDFIEINSKRDDLELLQPSDFEFAADFVALGLADGDDSIGAKPGQRPLNRNKKPGLRRAVIAVKDVAVIGVNNTDLARAQPERRRGQPFIDQRRNAPHGPGLGLMRMDDVRFQPKQFTQYFEDDDDVARAQFAAHLLDDQRRVAGGGREVTNVAFTNRSDTEE